MIYINQDGNLFYSRNQGEYAAIPFVLIKNGTMYTIIGTKTRG